MQSSFQVQIYYEDTDHSGLVYHANYLKYFERAREHHLDAAELSRMWFEDKLGFVVYKAEQTFKQGAVFGDIVEIRTTMKLQSAFRLRFEQNAYRVAHASKPVDEVVLVLGIVELACVHQEKGLVKNVPNRIFELENELADA